MTELDDGAPEVQAWDHERIRLQLAAACALKALFGHMAEPAAIFIPYDGQMLEVRKVTTCDIANSSGSSPPAPTSPTGEPPP